MGSNLGLISRRVISAVVLLSMGCGKPLVRPPVPPFPPKSRWEKPLDSLLVAPLATDGTRVFAAFSEGPVLAIEPTTGATVWTRPGLKPGFVLARPGLLLFVEKGGVVWGINPEDGDAWWKTTTQVQDVQSVRLDGNRVFLGGRSGLAAVVASTGEVRFDLKAKGVSDIDVAGDRMASLEEGVLVVRGREQGMVRFSVVSPEGEFGAPAIFADGRLVVGSGSRLVRAISGNGSFKWRFKVGARVKDRPLDFLDGKRVGVISFEGVFYELSLSGGDMRRRVLLSSRPFAAPFLVAGRVWASISEDEIAVIDERTEKLVARTKYGGGFLSSPIIVGGRVVAAVSSPLRIVGLGTAPPS